MTIVSNDKNRQKNQKPSINSYKIHNLVKIAKKNKNKKTYLKLKKDVSKIRIAFQYICSVL